MNDQPIHDSASNSFVLKHAPRVIGILSGFDRLRLRGTLRQLYCATVMEACLNACRILIKDFGQLVERTTAAVKERAKALAQQTARPFIFVPSSQTSKEDLVRGIAAKDNITEGLIAVLKAVEPCKSFQVFKNAQTKHIETKGVPRKCSHLYFYYEHPLFGFMHVRLQTWFPFQVDICLNGRHWLARQLDRAGIAYQKKCRRGQTIVLSIACRRGQTIVLSIACRRGQTIVLSILARKCIQSNGLQFVEVG